jgi:hypothetical protein
MRQNALNFGYDIYLMTAVIGLDCWSNAAYVIEMLLLTWQEVIMINPNNPWPGILVW